MTDVASLWSYLATTPLIWLTTTILAYLVADGVVRAVGKPPWANPVLLSVLLIAPVLWLTRTNDTTYFEGAQFIHFLLGPATVALAWPLWDNRDTILNSVAPISLALLVGSIVSAGSAIVLARAFGLPMEVLLSLAPKSTTAPVALGISEAIGGIPALTAVLVILTGIIGAVTVTNLMNLLRITDRRARGFCRWRCRTWNRDGSRVSSEPRGRRLCWHRHGTKRAAHKPDRAFPCVMVGLKALKTSALQGEWLGSR